MLRLFPEWIKFWKDESKFVYKTLAPRDLPPMLQEPVITVITVAALGDNVILPGQARYDVEILDVTVQPASAVTAALKEGNFFMSGSWQLVALEKWGWSSKIVDRNRAVILNLSAAVSCMVEIRWKPYFGRDYTPQW